jgi:DNA-directed RNA polymerase delta subunit
MPRPSLLSDSTQRAILESIENPEIDSFGFTSLCRTQPNVFGLPKSTQRQKVSAFRRDRKYERKFRPVSYINWCIRLNVEVNEADIGICGIYEAKKKAANSDSQPEPTQEQTFDSPDKNDMTPTRPTKKSPLRFNDPLDDVEDDSFDGEDDTNDKYGKSSDC